MALSPRPARSCFHFIRRWSNRGLNYWAVSDLAKDELAEFGDKFENAMKSGTTG